MDGNVSSDAWGTRLTAEYTRDFFTERKDGQLSSQAYRVRLSGTLWSHGTT
jgi:hypothetical protein